MALRHATDADCVEAMKLVRTHGGYAQASRASGIGWTTLRSRFEAGGRRGLTADSVVGRDSAPERDVIEAETKASAKASADAASLAAEAEALEREQEREPERKWSESGDDAHLEQRVSQPIKSLRELLEVCEVDGDEWRVKKWSCTAWSLGMKLRRQHHDTDGQKAGYSEKPFQQQQYRVSAEFERRIIENEVKAIIASYVEDATFLLGTAPPPPQPKWVAKPNATDSGSGLLFAACIFDVHVGKFAWGGETGPLGRDFDPEAAEDRFKRAVLDLAHKVSAFGDVAKILFPFGNDFTQVDNRAGTTTRGTPVDRSGSYVQMVRRSNRLALWAIRQLREVAPVVVPIVPGNHDSDTVFHQGELLSATFAGDEHVEVRNDAGPRLYYRYGRTLLGLCHHGDKPETLASMMPLEAAEDWSKSSWREFLTGHLHHRSVKVASPLQETRGVIVRTCPALCPPDRWHALGRFVGSHEGGEGFLYSPDGTLEAQVHANVGPTTPTTSATPATARL